MLTTARTTITNAAGSTAAGAQYVKIECISVVGTPTVAGAAIEDGEIVELPLINPGDGQYAAVAYDASVGGSSVFRITTITD